MSSRKPTGLPVLLTREKYGPGVRGREVVLAEATQLDRVSARRKEGGRIYLEIALADANGYMYTLALDAGIASEAMLDARDAIARFRQ